MKKTLSVTYWVAAIFLMALVLMSLGYRFGESVFIGTLFLPGALAVKYIFPKIPVKGRKKSIRDMIFVTLGIIATEMLLFMSAHIAISAIREGVGNIFGWPELPDLLINPIFIAIMLAALAVGNYYFGQWLDLKYPSKPGPITFLSDRKSISLDLDEILFVESNDSVTTVVATEERRFRNKTPISQWESILGWRFIRIHRSFLVNRDAIGSVDSDAVHVGDIELPISRKYKDSLRQLNDAKP